MLWLGVGIYFGLGIGTLWYTLRRSPSKKDYLAAMPFDWKLGVAILAIVAWPLVLTTNLGNRHNEKS